MFQYRFRRSEALAAAIAVELTEKAPDSKTAPEKIETRRAAAGPWAQLNDADAPVATFKVEARGKTTPGCSWKMCLKKHRIAHA